MRAVDALEQLRTTEDLSSPSLRRAWAAVDEWVQAGLRGYGSEADDIRQRALLYVLRGVGRLDRPPRLGWLARVRWSAVSDHYRRRRVAFRELRDTARVMRRTKGGEEPEELARDWVTTVGRGHVAPGLDAVIERVRQWAPGGRGDMHVRRAQCAIASCVLGMNTAEIRDALGLEASLPAIQQWVYRGREETLLPALRGWQSDVGDALREILVSSRRADYGRARVARRKAA